MSLKFTRPLGVGDRCVILRDSKEPKNVKKIVTIVARLHKCEMCSSADDAIFQCEGDGLIHSSLPHWCSRDHKPLVGYATKGTNLRRLDDEEKDEPKTLEAPLIEKRPEDAVH